MTEKREFKRRVPDAQRVEYCINAGFNEVTMQAIERLATHLQVKPTQVVRLGVINYLVTSGVLPPPMQGAE